MSVLDQVSQDVRQQIVNAAVRGDYHLLLGAGANFGARNADGADLPLATGLAAGLADHFGLQYTEDLPLVYDRAVRKTTAAEVFRLFANYFRDCEPPPWMENLVNLIWRRIWTFNVDDVVENSYSKWQSTSWQSARSVNWDNPIRDRSGLDIVHLHGYVGDLEVPSERLVFGISEYLDAREEGHAWHRAFGDYWQTEPFITIGASLVYEYDMAKIFRSRRKTSRVPSLYISPRIDTDMRDDLVSWDIAPIEATGEEFLAALVREVGPRRSASGRIWSRVDIPMNQMASFATSFRHLNVDDLPLVSLDHDLYAGDEPSWLDIVRERDARLPWVAELSSRVDKAFEGESPRVELLVTPRFAGVTAGLLRLALEQTKLSRDAFWFRSEHRFRVSDVLAYLKAAPPTVLIFDGAADFVDDIARVLDGCEQAKIAVAVVIAERDSRAEIVRNALPGRLVADHQTEDGALNLDRFGWASASALVEHMRNIGRLGRIADDTVDNQRRHFSHHGLFAGMEACTRGPEFRRRVGRNLGEIPDERVRKLVYLASVLDTIGYDLPISLAGAAGLSKLDAVAAASGTASGFLQHADDALHPRLRRLALVPAEELIGKPAAVETIRRAVQDLRPFINAQSQRDRTRPVRIVAGLMRARALQHWIGLENLDEFFESLVVDYGTNSRFWEQRAIAMELLERWSAAEGFARKATQVGAGDPWRLNTLGSILLARARREGEVGTEASLGHALEGVRALQRARDLDSSNYVPISTMLEAGLRFAEAHDRERLSIEFADLWQTWYADARHHEAGALPVNAARLLVLNERFLKVVVR